MDHFHTEQASLPLQAFFTVSDVNQGAIDPGYNRAIFFGRGDVAPFPECNTSQIILSKITGTTTKRIVLYRSKPGTRWRSLFRYY